jgi:hypothetical protein
LQTDRLLTDANYTRNAMTVMACWVGKTGSQIRRMFGSFRSGSAGPSWVHQVRDRGIRLKDEHPMTVLGTMAGTAFALGIGARVWRSRR